MKCLHNQLQTQTSAMKKFIVNVGTNNISTKMSTSYQQAAWKSQPHTRTVNDHHASTIDWV